MRNISRLLAAAAIAALCHGPLAQTITGPTLPAVSNNALDVTQAGVSVGAADNATALQAAINSAIASKRALLIPAPSGGGCYKYTAPLTIAGNLNIVGDWLQQNWPGSNQINIPSSSPQLLGSVLCPTSNGQPAVQISGTAFEVNIWNLGILFQTPLTGTGDGFNYVNGDQSQGLTGSTWRNVSVYGHDGNHYAFNFQNSIYFTGYDLTAVGGGLVNLAGSTAATLNYGNATFIQPIGQVVVGGSANGITLTASAAQRNNLITFIRPQVITNNVTGVSLANPPTSAQLIFSQDANTYAVTLLGPDFETNVGSGILISNQHSNSYDFNGMFTSAGSISSPSWGTTGLMYGPQTRTVNDSTATGTVAIEGLFAMPGFTQTATSAVTYTNLATLYLGKPTAGTNVTITRNLSLYADGGIFVNNSVTDTGEFVTGNTQINNTGSGTTQIGATSGTGLITIGNAADTVNFNPGTMQIGGTAGVSCAANTVTLATLVVTKGIVTHC